MSEGTTDPDEFRIAAFTAILAMPDRWDDVVAALNDSTDTDSALDNLADVFGTSREVARSVMDATIRVLTPWYRRRLAAELDNLIVQRDAR